MRLIEQIKNQLPLLTIIIISLGYVRLYYWYKWFNIDITSYLDFSEIILLSIKHLIVGFFIMIISTFLILFLRLNLKEYFTKRIKKRLKANSKNNLFSRTFQRFKNEKIFFLIMIFSILVHELLDYRNPFEDLFYNSWRVHYLSFKASEVLPIIFFSNLFIDELIFMINKLEYKIKNLTHYKYLLLILISSILLIKIVSEHQSFKKMFIGNQIINIETSNVKISTGKDDRYLGETRNYIFIYNFEKNTTLTINKNNIKYLSYGFNSELLNQ